MTLLELMMGMVIMSVLLTISTTAIVGMFSSTSKTQSVQISSTQLSTAFDRLDKQVRYASVIDQPVSSPNWSVSFRTDPPQATSPTCTELQIRPDAAGYRLVERSWTITVAVDGSTSATNVTDWNQLAAGISLTDQSNTAVVPFTLPSVAGTSVQQLELRLVDVSGAARSQAKSSTQITFSALNSAAVRTAVASGQAVGSACPDPVSP
jgi:type II secretory pathway pseudopilin PulG